MAKAWYERAAKQNSAKAQIELGMIYANGLGVTRDYHAAKDWYTLAAQQGDAAGQFQLGYMYDQGYGVKQDFATAKYWYGQACDNGYQNGCNHYRELNLKGY